MKLHYTIYGDGAITFVLLHYFGGNKESWKWVTHYLSKNYKLVIITLPGFGTTPPLTDPSIYNFSKYINDCINELNLKNYVLCGHSMSAKLILYATQVNKDNRPRGLVLIAPSPPTVEEMSEDEKNRMLNHPNRAECIITVENSTIKNLKRKKLKTAIVSQMEVHPMTWNWWIEVGMDNNISARIKSIDVPSYVICSKDDPVISMNQIYDEVMPYLFRPRLIQLSGCGHLIPLESPRKLAKQLEKIGKAIAGNI